MKEPSSPRDQERACDTSPLVSIIIPVASSIPPVIRDCLSSISTQDYVNKEVLIIDRSTSPQINTLCEKYSARVINSELSKPLARNFGVQKSRGSIIVHLDADMCLSESVLSSCVQHIRNGCDALVIPESSGGRGFLQNCRRLEKEAYNGNFALEAVRCVTRKVHDWVGGFDQDTGSIDEYPYHAKIEAAGFLIGRSEGWIKVTEPLLNLEKKFGHGRYVWRYWSKYRQKAQAQFSPMKRIRAFTEIARKHPLRFVPLMVLKLMEFTALAAGSALGAGPGDNTFSRKRIASHFDGASATYENVFKERPGGRLIDEEERSFLQRLVESQPPASSQNSDFQVALDLGAGNGRLTEILLNIGCFTVSVDISHEMCKRCKERLDGPRFEAVRGDMEFLPFRPRTISVIMSIRSAKYVENIEVSIREIHRVLRPGGTLILEMPNAFSPFLIAGRILSHLTSRITNTETAKYLGQARFLTGAQGIKLLRANRLTPIASQGVSLLPQFILAKIARRSILTAIAVVDNLVTSNPVGTRLSRSLFFIGRNESLESGVALINEFSR